MAQNKVQYQEGFSLSEFIEAYGTEEKCLADLEHARWPEGFRCQRCGESGEHPTFVKTGQWARMEGQSGGEQAMTSEDRARLEACTAEILYRNSNRENLETPEVIEQAVRQQILEEVSPRVALFLSTSRPRLAEAVAVD